MILTEREQKVAAELLTEEEAIFLVDNFGEEAVAGVWSAEEETMLSDLEENGLVLFVEEEDYYYRTVLSEIVLAAYLASKP
jgi:hypothetical protein